MDGKIILNVEISSILYSLKRERKLTLMSALFPVDIVRRIAVTII